MNLLQHVKLVEVTSNIWGTKFKIHGLAKTLPANLGQVTYKTSLLHLQPRQMTLVITELRDDYPTGPDPNFNPNIFSEDEEEQPTPVHKPHVNSRRLNEQAPPIAPMSPRPNRFPSRSRNNNNHQPSPLATGRDSRPPVPSLGPLAKAESYEEEEDSSHADSRNGNCREGTSYSRIVSQYSRSSSTSSNQSRVAISPLYCEGSVPTLQSPKNAVAPSDIIFDRPPAGGQTTLMSYSSNTDYASNVVQVKNALSHDHSSRTNSHVNPVPLNLNLNLERIEAKYSMKQTNTNLSVIRKHQKDLQFIDEEAPSKISTPGPGTSASSGVSMMKRTPTVVSISPAGIPDSITRSCSVGYLDDVEIVPSDIALSMLRKETPYKRLVLVDKKRQRKKRLHEDYNKRQKLRQAVKSKSLDFCDIIQDNPTIRQDLLNLFQQMPKVSESSENDEGSSSDQNTVITPPLITQQQQQPSTSKFNFKSNLRERLSGYSRTPILNRKERPKSCSICKQISPTVNSKETVCATCKASVCINQENLRTPKKTTTRKSLHEPSLSFDGACSSSSSCGNRASLSDSLAKSSIERKSKRNVEIVTSFTDSPLFSRKYRHPEPGPSHARPIPVDPLTPILVRRSTKQAKELVESRRRRREQEFIDNTIETEPTPVEVTPVEPRSYVSLHTQVKYSNEFYHMLDEKICRKYCFGSSTGS